MFPEGFFSNNHTLPSGVRTLSGGCHESERAYFMRQQKACQSRSGGVSRAGAGAVEVIKTSKPTPSALLAKKARGIGLSPSYEPDNYLPVFAY